MKIAIQIIMPIITFVLGCLFALKLKSVENENSMNIKSVDAIFKLTKEWYNQLHEIIVKARQQYDPKKILKEIDAYSDNRIILPDIIYHLGILKKNNGYEELIDETESFLKDVTNYDPNQSEFQCVCSTYFALSLLKKNEDNFLLDKKQSSSFISRIDRRVQRISRLASEAQIKNKSIWNKTAKIRMQKLYRRK